MAENTMLRTPYYQISLNGEVLSPLLHSLIQSVTFTDSASEASTATIQLTDPDYILLDDPRLVRATAMKIYGGWVNDNNLWLSGFISSVEVNFPDEGPPIISIMVMDESFIMDTLPRYDIFKDVFSDDIAKKIAQSYGLKFEGDKGKRQYRHKVQSKQTDIKFLRAIADSEWFIVRVINGTLYWKERTFTAGEKGETYWYRRPPFNLINFQPKVVQADRLDGITEGGINPKTGQPEEEATDEFVPPDILEQANRLNDGAGLYMHYDAPSGTWSKVYKDGSGGRYQVDASGDPIIPKG